MCSQWDRSNSRSSQRNTYTHIQGKTLSVVRIQLYHRHPHPLWVIIPFKRQDSPVRPELRRRNYWGIYIWGQRERPGKYLLCTYTNTPVERWRLYTAIPTNVIVAKKRLNARPINVYSFMGFYFYGCTFKKRQTRWLYENIELQLSGFYKHPLRSLHEGSNAV